MKTHYRHRRLNPTNRLLTSRYRIDVEKVMLDDKLIVKITPIEYPDFEKEFLFYRKSLIGKNSIHFKYINNEVIWQGGIKPDMILK